MGYMPPSSVLRECASAVTILLTCNSKDYKEFRCHTMFRLLRDISTIVLPPPPNFLTRALPVSPAARAQRCASRS